MQNNYLLFFKRSFLIIIVSALGSRMVRAQSVYLPLSYDLDQKFNSTIYSTKTSFHTSLRPFLIDSLLTPKYNQIMNRGVDSTRKSWVIRKIFNEHLFDVKKKEYTFYGDFLPDLQLGHDFSNSFTTDLNTRGYQLGGTIGSKFSFYTSGYEDQAKFPRYLKNYINSINFVPGEAYDRDFGQSTSSDWSYVTAILSYSPTKKTNITLGEDKTFIGDGYRSLLLSDFAANYPLLRLTTNFGKFQYMIMWAYMEDFSLKKFDTFGSNRRKWGAFHYLDWNPTNRLSFGFFNAVIAQETDDKGNYHGFDVNYINPLVYSRSLGPSSQPDNVFVGFTGKFKILDKTAIYGQVLFDRFKASDVFSGSSNADNTNGIQVGIRGADLFRITNFNYLFEYNAVKPYTYASNQLITAYSFYRQPLGDPLGANFREFIGILNYSIGRFDIKGQVNYARYGLDPTSADDFGRDLTRVFTATTTTTSNIGQGELTDLYYGEGTISYLINPKYNLRFELGGLVRDEKNNLGSKKTTLITFGLRSTFRDLYHDF